MHEDKTPADTLERTLSSLRTASRVRARRLALTGHLVSFLCLLLFLAVSLFAARETWISLDAPSYVLVCFAGLATALQQMLGLRVRGGRLRRRRTHQPLWWALAGASLICLASLHLGGVL